VPVRPHHLAAMAAAIVQTAPPPVPRRTGGPVTVHYESGHRQTIGMVTARRLRCDQGGVVAVDTDAGTGYSLYAGPSCHPALVLCSERGRIEFDIPVRAGSIRIEDSASHSAARIRHGCV